MNVQRKEFDHSNVGDAVRVEITGRHRATAAYPGRDNTLAVEGDESPKRCDCECGSARDPASWCRIENSDLCYPFGGDVTSRNGRPQLGAADKCGDPVGPTPAHYG